MSEPNQFTEEETVELQRNNNQTEKAPQVKRRASTTRSWIWKHFKKFTAKDEKMEILYYEYVRIHPPSSTSESSTSSSILGKRSNTDVMVPKPRVRNKLREKMKTNSIEQISGLKRYLDESVEVDSTTFDILTWWKVNSPRFPTLALMAKDLFAIPVSTVASKSVFSTSGRVLDPFRSSLTHRIVESLICTQDWLRTSTSANPEVEEDWDTIQDIDKELEEIGISSKK